MENAQLLAFVILMGAWFSGRYSQIPASPLDREAAHRGSAVLDGGRRDQIPAEVPIFVIGWYLVVLPLEGVAGLSPGRAGRIPGRREAPGP